MAGDFRSAASRYKQYLQTAPPGPEASTAAANLYSTLLDFLTAGDDAFRVMNEFGDKFRQTPEVKKYDSWSISTAGCSKAYPAVARRLVTVFADQLPLEEERLDYWDSLDWLMNEITYPRPEMYEALPDCRKLVTMIRENPERTPVRVFRGQPGVQGWFRGERAGGAREGVRNGRHGGEGVLRCFSDRCDAPGNLASVHRRPGPIRLR